MTNAQKEMASEITIAAQISEDTADCVFRAFKHANQCNPLATIVLLDLLPKARELHQRCNQLRVAIASMEKP